MENTHFLKIEQNFCGLCNQLNYLVGGICEQVALNTQILIIEKFQMEIYSNKFCPISDIIDIKKSNIFLEKYNIKLIDQYYLNFKISSVLFGIDDKTIDITEEIINKYYKNDLLFIPSNTNLLNIQGDPSPMIKKKIYIKYELSGYEFNCEFNEENEYPTKDIVLNFVNREFKYSKNWRTEENKLLFNEIIINIHFNNNLINKSKHFFESNKINTSEKINVIHLRVEDDAINHWGKHNTNIFKDNLEQKYVNLIQKYIHKNEIIIILSYSLKNRVTDFLHTNGYNIFYINKEINQGREINAAIDMIIGESCNNLFIGPAAGSTFSNTLTLRIKNNKKLILFDLDNIDRIEEIIHK
jgi:hypothetical protein